MSAKTNPRVRIELASAERLLGSLADRSIDLLITDPPYTSLNRSSTSGHLRDWFADGLTWPQIGRVFTLARAKLKADGVLMAMTNNDGLREAIGALERAGFTGIRTITWDRQYPGLGGGLRHQTEFVLVGRLPGSRTLAGVDLVSVAAVGPGTADRYPTAKPDGLGRELAAMAKVGPGSLVVDPFVGSGALLVGAAERGATVVGGDVAQRAVRLASTRLARVGSGAGRPSSLRTSGKPATKTAPGRSSGRPATAATRARPGKPSGSSRTSTAATRAGPGKPSGSSRTSTAATRARPGKPSGSSRTSTAATRTKPGKPSGSSRPSAGQGRARPGKRPGKSR
jgi:hypothetical protein